MPIETKVTAAGAAGSAVVVLVWVASLFGVAMPELVAESIVALAAFGAGYLAPHTRRDDVTGG